MRPWLLFILFISLNSIYRIVIINWSNSILYAENYDKLKCCTRSKCNATILIVIQNAITTKKSSVTRYALKADGIDEILTNKENYDSVFHRQL